jgi:serine/threonine protein kinase
MSDSSKNESSGEKYRQEKMLGEGTWGFVFLARRQKDNLQVAVKRIKARDTHLGLNFTALREIRFLKAIKSINVVEVSTIEFPFLSLC